MFRFSIRELMLVMLVALLGAAWLAEHQRWRTASSNADQAKREIDLAKDEIASLKLQKHNLREVIRQIDSQLADHRLQIDDKHTLSATGVVKIVPLRTFPTLLAEPSP